MRQLNSLFLGLSKKQYFIICVFFASFLLLLLPLMAYWIYAVTGTTLTPDTNFIYELDQYYLIRNLYNTNGINLYVIQRFTLDLLWPIVYTSFFLAVLAKYHKIYRWNRSFMIIPVLAFIFDITENVLASLFMKSVGGEFLISFLMTITFTKWFLVSGVTLIIVYELLKYYLVLKRKTESK